MRVLVGVCLVIWFDVVVVKLEALRGGVLLMVVLVHNHACGSRRRLVVSRGGKNARIACWKVWMLSDFVCSPHVLCIRCL